MFAARSSHTPPGSPPSARPTPIARSSLALIAELDAGGHYDDRALMAFDERIHRAVYRATHNQFLVATLEEYYLLALRIWFLALEQPRELEQAVLQHRVLLEAIVARDGAEAERIMRAHVDKFETAIRRVLLET